MSSSPSPPSTPLSSTVRDGEERFKPILSPCEWVEDYRPGGYHPVTLGDFFKDSQYKVIRKLGDGAYSTVWLACDTISKRYVALKILVADAIEQKKELQILHKVSASSSKESCPVTQLLDEFIHKGPNGSHKCLVFEPMGPTVNSMVEELPQFKPRKIWMKVRYPPQMARSILKQNLQGLVFLHDNGIAHGDLQPGNMLFALKGIDAEAEDVLRQREDVDGNSISPPVERLDGKQDLWAPPYLCIAQPLVSLTPFLDDFTIKLSDMGGAYFFDDPPEKPVTPLGLRAPELVLAGKVTSSLDIWSFGCLVFELITGLPLFCVPGSGHEDDDHLLALTAALGPLPDELFSLWKNSSQYFTPERKLFNSLIDAAAYGYEPQVLEQDSMEEMFDEAEPDVSQDEGRKIKQLIRWILQYDPEMRPSASEILQDPWFSRIET